MRRLAAVLAVVALLAAGCGDKKKDDSASSSDTTTSTTTSAESTTTTAAAGSGAPTATGSGRGATATTAAATGAGGATTTTAKSGSKPTGSKAAPGTYTYNRTGKSSSNVFGEQSLDGPVTLKVDPPTGDDQRSVQSSSEGSTETVLRFLPEGAYFTFLKTTNRGITREFRPNPAVLAVPADPAVGRTWSWTVTSSDGATTLNASFKVERNETLSIGGEQVPTVVLAVVLKTSGDIEYTVNQTNWVSMAKGLSVRIDETGNGKAGSVTLSSQSSMTLQSTKPS